MKGGGAGVAHTAAMKHAATVAGGRNGRIKRVVLMLHDFDISPRLGL
jgi:hypothetical protein